MSEKTESRERRVTIPEDVWESLRYYVNDEKMKVSETIRDAITPESIAWEILKNHLHTMGHYPPKRE